MTPSDRVRNGRSRALCAVLHPLHQGAVAQRARSAGRGDRQSAPAAQTAPATERLKAAQLGEGMAEREAEADSVRAAFRGVRAPFRDVRVAFQGVRALEITVFGRRLKLSIEAIGLFVGAGGGF